MNECLLYLKKLAANHNKQESALLIDPFPFYTGTRS
jgi:hypothetical protein